MATKWTSPVWRMPENSNQSKLDNYSLDFEGYNWGFIDLGNIVEILPGQPNPSGSQNISNPEWSCSAFVKFGSTAMGSVSMLISTGRGGGSTYWEFRKSASNKIEGYFRTAAGSYTTITGDTTVVSDTWYHVCLTWSSGNLNLYLNGNSDCSAVSATNFYFAGDGFLPLSTIAKFRFTTNAGSDPLNGKLSQLSIFNYGLSETQVKYLFNNNAGGSTPNPQNPMAIAGPTPIAYYPLGQSATGDDNTLTTPNESDNGDTVFDFVPNDYIDCGTSLGNSLGTTSELSVSFWAKIPTGNAGKGFFTFGDFSSTVGEFTVYMYTDTTMRFRGSFGNNNITGFTLDSWTNVVCVFNGNGNCNVYFDGVPVHSFTLSGQTLDLTSKKVIIGSWFSNAQGIDGEISNVQVWNTSLTSSDVTTIYNGGRPYTGTQPKAANLKAWYKLDVDTSSWESVNSDYWVLGDSSSNYLQNVRFSPGSKISFGDIITDGLSEFSVSLWYNRGDNIRVNPIEGIIKKSGVFALSLFRNNNAPLVAELTTVNGSAAIYSSSPSATLPNIWYMLTITYDGSNFNFYVNETAQGSPQSSTGSLVSNTNAIELDGGNFNSSNGGLYSPMMSNAIIWDKGLTSGEVSTLFNSGSPINELSSIPQNGNVKGWWKLNSTTISDSSGNSQSGTISGTVALSNIPVSAKNGTSSGMTTANLVTSDLNRSLLYSSYSMDFDGTDHIDTNSAVFSGVSSFTASAWITFDTSLNLPPIFSQEGSASEIIILLRYHNTLQKFQLYSETTNGLSIAQQPNNSFTPVVGKWYNIAAVYDGSNLKIYLDTVEIATQAQTGTLVTGTDTFKIGKYSSNYFNGKMSNVSVFNKALSENDILTIYNGGAPNDISSLLPVGWWSLSGDSYFATNWICPDLSANSNNGTSSNLPVTALVGNAPGSTANGTGTNMAISNDLQGDAPNSDKNAISVNMVATNRVSGSGNVP